MFVYPTNAQAKLPEVFSKFAQLPAEPARLDPVVIAKNRDGWIKTWSEVVLK
jgi:thiamine transport system substrate-binding protein